MMLRSIGMPPHDTLAAARYSASFASCASFSGDNGPLRAGIEKFGVR